MNLRRVGWTALGVAALVAAALLLASCNGDDGGGGPDPEPPAIESFSAEPTEVEAGDEVRISWSVVRADTITVVDGDETLHQGAQSDHEIVDRPEDDASYEILVSGPGGSVSETRSVSVLPAADPWPELPSDPFSFDLAAPVETNAGGIVAGDLDGDGPPELLVTTPGRIVAYSPTSGEVVWDVSDSIRITESANGGTGYPGLHAAGVALGEWDASPGHDVAYIAGGRVVVRSGVDGSVVRRFDARGAEAIAVAHIRGADSWDLLLQIGQGELIAVGPLGGQVWRSTDWLGVEHSQVIAVDLDGDPLDEVPGVSAVDSDGSGIPGWGVPPGTALGSMDSIAVRGLGLAPRTILLAEQGGRNATIATGVDGVVFSHRRTPPAVGDCAREIDPDKLSVGNFQGPRDGPGETFARSACGLFPWVLDSTGSVVADWDARDKLPDWWFFGPETPGGDRSEGGIDVVTPIDWNGGALDFVALKERHIAGAVAVVNPITGSVVRPMPNVRAERLFVADVAGDHREEVIVVERGRILVFAAGGDPAQEGRPRWWEDESYRRRKGNHNYYSTS